MRNCICNEWKRKDSLQIILQFSLFVRCIYSMDEWYITNISDIVNHC